MTTDDDFPNFEPIKLSQRKPLHFPFDELRSHQSACTFVEKCVPDDQKEQLHWQHATNSLDAVRTGGSMAHARKALLEALISDGYVDE
ncbi:MAG TPA: hypothetical protein VNY53_14150 [Bradyrhizobium sp.]|jgi:hypothetical protein|nr:hypothetical protein [Bradyrhizobium sp.]